MTRLAVSRRGALGLIAVGAVGVAAGTTGLISALRGGGSYCGPP